jgi:hypothetical protein
MALPPIQPIGVGTAVPHPTQAWEGSATTDWLVAPGDTNPPVIFEPPPGLTGGVPQVWLAASGGPSWGGCQVWASTDGTTYGLVGTIYSGAVMGSLTAAFPSGPDPDTADSLAVSLAPSRGQVLSGTRADADNLITLCYVDGELVAYETASLTAPYSYTLGTYLRRGCYGTPIGPHAAGSQFARLNSSIFKYTFAASFAGQSLFVKLPSFNIFGQALQSLAAIGDTPHTTTGAGLDPLENPVFAALAAGIGMDWGEVGTSVIAVADLGNVAVAVGATINLGTIP